jgi:hypothetical protein
VLARVWDQDVADETRHQPSAAGAQDTPVRQAHLARPERGTEEGMSHFLVCFMMIGFSIVPPITKFLDRSSNIGPVISLWELDKFKKLLKQTLEPLKS